MGYIRISYGLLVVPQQVSIVKREAAELALLIDGIDGGQKDYSNSGGVSRLIWYSSACAYISETGVQGTSDHWYP